MAAARSAQRDGGGSLPPPRPVAAATAVTSAASSSGVGSPAVHDAEQGRSLVRWRLAHSGMFPCFLGGRFSRLVRSSRSALMTSRRVSAGRMTASMYPRSAAM